MFINRITLNEEYTELDLKASEVSTKIKPHTRLDLKAPLFYTGGDSPGIQAANIIKIYNGDFNYYDMDQFAFGLTTSPNDGITIRLSSEYWDKNDTILLELNNLSYVYNLGRDINIKLEQ